MKMLLESKFFQPRPRQEILVRPRLLEQLNTGLERKLILVLAQAGFGKSTLVAQWLNTLIQENATIPPAVPNQGHYQGRNRVAWLSLDESDNDPLRFFDYLITALQRADSNIGQHARLLLSGPQPPSSLESLIISLINDLTNLSGHLVLTLDDYHTITSQEVHRAIHYFINHAPEFFHLMIVSRVEPPLPLTRWRMYRELSEIRENDLRFTLEEATTYLLDTMRCTISPTEVVALEQRTEGWIVGLHLAALTLHSRSDSTAFITEFAGGHAYIVDYLTEEVLQSQSSEIQEFLFQTSLLTRFSGPLCDAVMGHTGSQKILEHLERSHLFVIPLDNERGWYRYHHLFAEMLRRRAQEHNLQHGAEIYRRATKWYIEKGLVMEAIEYALAAENGDYAAQLIERSLAPLAARGQFVTLLQWLTHLPYQTLLAHPMLCATRARISLRRHQLDEAEEWLEHTWHALATQTPQDPKILGEAYALSVDLALNRGKPAETIRLGNEALAILSEDLHLSRGEILLFMGIAYFWDDQYAKATEITALAAFHASRAGDTLTTLYALVNQARFTQIQGKLREALAMFDKTWAYAVSQNINQLPLMGSYLNNRGELLYEWNKLEEAERFFLQGIHLSEQMHNPRSMLRSYTLLLPIHLARGEREKADEMLRLSLAVVQQYQLPSNLLHECHRTIVQKWLADGDLEAVGEWIERRGLPLVPSPKGGLEYESLLVARYFAAKGDLKAAAALLESATLSARTLGKVTTSIALHAFYALVLQQMNDKEGAFNMIKEALEVAAPEGFIRTFLDEGKAMQSILVTSQPRLSQKLQGYVNLLLQTFDQPTSHVRPQPALPQRSTHTLSDDPHLSESIEPLSERELEVLRLVADGLSDSQIASRLVLATGTVKRHLNNIYGKLGVHTRMHALARARAHNLL